MMKITKQLYNKSNLLKKFSYYFNRDENTQRRVKEETYYNFKTRSCVPAHTHTSQWLGKKLNIWETL
jgi:hypothetical protein